VALGIFVVALYTVAPLIWFGSHLLAGRWVRPPLTRAESLVLGVTGLAILAIPGTAFFAAQAPLQAASREIGQRREVPADNPPLQHTVQAVQRYHLAGAGLSIPSRCWAHPTPARRRRSAQHRLRDDRIPTRDQQCRLAGAGRGGAF